MVIKKKTLGSNPLEAYLSTHEINSEQEKHEDKKQESDLGRKQRITIHLPIVLIERIKNVVYWEPGVTLTAFAQEAFEKAVDALEKKKGTVYPERHQKLLKGGRPLG